jgi:hypothetical protein
MRKPVVIALNNPPGGYFNQLVNRIDKMTSSNFPNQYRIHGQFELSVEGHILIARGRGPWNLEAIKAYGIDSNAKIQLFADEPWGLLAIVEGEPFHTPESVNALVNIIDAHRKHGRCATALVLLDVTSPIFAKLMLSRIYVEAREHFYFANDEASALMWLTDQIVHNAGRS